MYIQPSSRLRHIGTELEKEVDGEQLAEERVGFALELYKKHQSDVLG